MYIPSPYQCENQEQIKRFIQENSFGVLTLQNTKMVPDVRDATEAEFPKKGPIVKTTTVRKSLARHLPFELDINTNHYNDGKEFISLTAHLGKHYPIYDCFEDGDEALVIFHGPQPFISPSWYDNLEGATWNYIAIHVYGKIEKLDVEESAKRKLDKAKANRRKYPENFIYKVEEAERIYNEIKKGNAPELEKLIRTQLYKYEQRMRNEQLMSMKKLKHRFAYLKQFLGAIRINIENVKTDVQAAFKLSQDQNEWTISNIIDHLNKSGYPGSVAIAEEMEKRREFIRRGKDLK